MDDHERWARPDLSDEDLAKLNPKTRASVEHARRNLGGRPAIGPRVMVAFPPDILARVDHYAARADERKPERCSRTEAIRLLVELGLAGVERKRGKGHGDA